MIDIIVKVFAGFNALGGIYFIAQGFWPTSDPSQAKSAVLVVIYVLWGLTFVGLGACLALRKSFTRMWTLILYGLIAFVIIASIIGEFQNQGKYIFYYPIRYAFTYLLWLAVSVGPFVFMLRRDVKEYFLTVEKDGDTKE